MTIYDSNFDCLVDSFTVTYSSFDDGGAKVNTGGVYYQKNDVFAHSPLFPKRFFFPKYSENSSFPRISTCYSLTFAFLLVNIIFFPQPTKNSYFSKGGGGEMKIYTSGLITKDKGQLFYNA